MKRVWIVDDTIPIHELYRVDAPLPTSLDTELVRYLVEQVPQEAWIEPEVRELCAALCRPEYESTFFLSPAAMLASFGPGSVPPHAVVFDWQYPGSSDERSRDAVEKLLRTSFAYVQVYTHLGEGGVEPQLAGLREKFGGRLLAVRAKADVTPARLAEEIRNSWEGTIAGEVADRVREEAFNAVERSLIEMCAVSRGVIASMTQGLSENLVEVVLSKVRDEIGTGVGDVLGEIMGADHAGESSDDLRRLMSVWYYFFPVDNRVRRGDLVEIGGELGFVITPLCHLERFSKKTGRQLTWVRCARLDQNGLMSLRADGYEVDNVGGSIIAAHGKAGETLIVLPNVPEVFGRREALADYVILCHSWKSRSFLGTPSGPLTYESLPDVKRRCTVVDPFASAIVSRACGVMSSPGMPDLPGGERARLQNITKNRPE
jgi:hypothetical protein